MKRLSLLSVLLLSVLLFNSCQEDECIETVCVERVVSVESYSRMYIETIDLSNMSEDLTINAQGNLEEYQTSGDLNLNGYELRLVNIKLTVVGNMNGNGSGGGSKVSTLGRSVVCIQGSIQNDPYYNANDFTCESLSSGGLGTVDGGDLEAKCGEKSIGDTFRSGNYWYIVVPCN